MEMEVNADTFEQEVVQSEMPVVVDFWGPQCEPCLALMPHVEKLAEKYVGKLKVVKVDATKNKRLCINLRVLDWPTFLFYNKGEEVNRLTGNDLSIEEIAEATSKLAS
ncbi:MAG: hypothetical protein KAI94_03390 [Anaerolineales bacterium]|nr:hypothetical protein [Anaerolineales bacterium]